jgi:hypothetical protein
MGFLVGVGRSGWIQAGLVAAAVGAGAILAWAQTGGGWSKGVSQLTAPVASNFRACIAFQVSIGVPLAQAVDICQAEANQTVDDSGFNVSRPAPGSDFGKGMFVDPKQIAGACGGADPRVSRDPPSAQLPAQKLEFDIFHFGARGESADGGVKFEGGMFAQGNYGSYSWGGTEGTHLGEDGQLYDVRGLDKETSEKEKSEAIGAAMKAYEDYAKARDAAKAETDSKKKADLEKVAADKKKAWDEANKKAQRDPNVQPANTGGQQTGQQTGQQGGGTKMTGNTSVCRDVMDSVRQTIAECNRTGWKHATCQSIIANVYRCPDPSQILVDPDQGYTCGAQPDPGAVIEAYNKLCARVVRTVEGGGAICGGGVEAPEGTTPSGHLPIYGPGSDTKRLCSDPRAMVDPEGELCAITFRDMDFGQPGVEEVMVVWGDKLGGGFFVPLPPKPLPIPGGPRPGPTGGPVR